jgi:transcriptional regulator with XRE-family HTH domain
MQKTPAERTGAEVRGHMARVGMTQAQLGEAIGLAQTAVSRRLSGEIAFDVTELHKIAEVLGVPVAELLGAPATP